MKQVLTLFILTLIQLNCFSQMSLENHLTESSYYPEGIHTADMDQDGDIDILCASSIDDMIAFYENLGNNNFARQKVITKNTDGTKSVYSADLDQDGDLDIISGSVGTNGVSWYKNLGNNNFSGQIPISSQYIGVSDIKCFDFDQDGDDDIIFSGNDLGYFENFGNGSFGSKQVISAGSGIRRFDFSDMDNDGDLDLICGSEVNDNVTAYENQNGVFGAEIVIESNLNGVSFVHLSDFDGDGFIDIGASVYLDDKIVWIKNIGSWSFNLSIVISTLVDGAQSIYSDDLDNDGDLDIISSSFIDNKIAWYENLGSGIFGAQQVIPNTSQYPFMAVAADLNNDGLSEIITIAASKDILFHVNQGVLAFSSQIQISATVYVPREILTFDLENDGDMDVACISALDDEFSIFKNNGNGTFEEQIIISRAIDNGEAIFSGDLNSDGYTDIVIVSSDDDELVWYQNLGNGTFSNEIIISTTLNNPTSVCLEDLDNDGDLDIITTSLTVGLKHVSWFVNNGSGVFGSEQIIQYTLQEPSFVRSADINSDGNMDIIVASYLSSNIYWIDNLGGGNFGSDSLITSFAVNPTSIQVADLDNDGDPDIISSSFGDNKIAWYENISAGLFSGQNILSVNADGASYVFPADLDGDGNIDILVSSGQDDKIAWFQNLGNGIFSSEIIISQNAWGAECVYAEDLDNDGDLEVVSASIEDGKIAWYENLLNNPFDIKGEIYFDANQDGLRDSNEVGINLLQPISNPINSYAYSNADGSYFMNLDQNQLGNHIITINNATNWNITSDSLLYNVDLATNFVGIDSIDFGVFPSDLVDSINVEIIGAFPRCNTVVNYWVTIQNLGTTFPSGTVELTLADSLIYLNSDILPDSIVGQAIYWSYDSLFFNQTKLISFQVIMPDFQSIGIPLISYLTGKIDSLGTLLHTNQDSINQELVCAYDPNDKIATPSGVDSLGWINRETDYLEYTIRFQNTGNDTAINVQILDRLDQNLKWETFTPLASSHPMTIHYDNSGEVSFKFENILLPDSIVNEPASHGFVKFGIDIKENLTHETPIYNTAEIYFDFNPAIITNTKINSIFDCNTIYDKITFSNLFCFNEIVSINVEMDTSEYDILWLVDSINPFSDSVSWLADTSGVFSVKLDFDNEICKVDTIIVFEIYEEFLQSTPDLYICAGDSILILNNYQSLPSMYYDTLQSVKGCDSVVSVMLNVHDHFTADIDTIEICQYDSTLIFNEFQFTPGLYYDSLQNNMGCDSILTVYLHENSIFNSNTDTVDICLGDSIQIFGSYQANENIYYDSLSSQYGCDSIVSKFLNVIDASILNLSVSDSVVCTNYGTVYLIASPMGGTYFGNGVYDNYFSPDSVDVGLHEVFYEFMDANGCQNQISVNISVVNCLGLENKKLNPINLFPNPMSNYTVLQFGQAFIGDGFLLIYDQNGKVIYEQNNIEGSSVIIYRDELSSGNYLIRTGSHKTGKSHSIKMVVN